MKLWMDVQRDLEFVMNDHQRIFDGWGEGGVDGVVFGLPCLTPVSCCPAASRCRWNRRRP